MIQAAIHHESAPVAADRSEDREAVHGPVRSCVGCGERVDVAGNHALVRLIISPEGEVAVDARGGGFGRGAHVHPRPDCLQKAVERGLARSAKVKTNTLVTEAGELLPLTREALAEAIRRSTDRRIEGLLLSAKRSRRLAIGADAVRGAWGRGDAELVLVACDAAANEMNEVRQAIAEGRGVAWGDKVRIATFVHGASRTETRDNVGVGVGVIAVSSRTIAAALLEAIHIADGVTGTPVKSGPRSASKGGASRARSRTSEESPREGVAKGDQPRLEGSSAASACAPAPEGGKLRPRTVTMGSSPGPQASPARSGNRGERGRATFTRGRRPG
jgi:predicted RNA-binding protein YlxR (DUF448 family)